MQAAHPSFSLQHDLHFLVQRAQLLTAAEYLKPASQDGASRTVQRASLHCANSLNTAVDDFASDSQDATPEKAQPAGDASSTICTFQELQTSNAPG